MSIKADVENMNAMSLQGKYWEALDKYYVDDAVRKIGGLVPLVGKAMIREQVQDFINGCMEFHRSEPKAVAIDEDNQVSMVEWFVEYTHKFYGHIRQSHVAVQRWRGGKIYEESLYLMQEKVNH